MRSSRLVSVIDPVKARAVSGASEASSGATSSVTMGDPDAASRVTSDWPISPPAPVMRMTGLRRARFSQNDRHENNGNA